MSTKDSYEIDPARVADEVCDAKGIEDYSIRAGAILGARAMFDAVKPQPATVVDWAALDCAPKDGTFVRLLIRPDDESHSSFEDSEEPFTTIGFNTLADTGEDRWQFAGWDWSHDCFTDGEGEVLSWAPFDASAPGRPAPHPDDAAADRFAAAMKAKLAEKRAEGFGGWEDKEACSNGHLSQMLVEHVHKGDPVDIGNLAMMLHQRGEVLADDRQRCIAKVERRRATQAMNSPCVIPFGYSCETCGAPDEEHCRSRPLAAQPEGR